MSAKRYKCVNVVTHIICDFTCTLQVLQSFDCLTIVSAKTYGRKLDDNHIV
eukprot:UN12897